jgi:hypothetical protein
MCLGSSGAEVYCRAAPVARRGRRSCSNKTNGQMRAPHPQRTIGARVQTATTTVHSRQKEGLPRTVVGASLSLLLPFFSAPRSARPGSPPSRYPLMQSRHRRGRAVPACRRAPLGRSGSACTQGSGSGRCGRIGDQRGRQSFLPVQDRAGDRVELREAIVAR